MKSWMGLAFVAVVWGGVGMAWVENRPAIARADASRSKIGARDGDPQSGMIVPLPKNDVFGRKIADDGSAVLLVYGGSCTSCSIHHLDFGRLPFGRYPEIILLFDSPPQDILRSLAAINPKLRLIADPAGELCDQLKASWGGRWYELEGGKLANVQHTPLDARFRLAK